MVGYLYFLFVLTVQGTLIFLLYHPRNIKGTNQRPCRSLFIAYP